MAKSLRSKWRRRMRAAKREKYAVREDARLIKMLEAAGDYQVVPKVKEEPVDIIEPTTPQPEDMNQDDDPILVQPYKKPISASRRRSRSRKSRRDHQRGEYSSDESDDEAAAEREMDTAQPPKEKVERIFNKKTKRDQFGNYPQWMSIRKIQKQKKQNKRLHSKRMRLQKLKK